MLSFVRRSRRAIRSRFTLDRLEERAMLAGITADFNADGFADLAVGVPGEDIGSFVDAGAVQVIYGSPTGLSTRNDFWHENRVGMPAAAAGAAEGEQFGAAIAAGDFNGDGFSDLAIGAPFENVGATADAGAVFVIYGSPTGLRAGTGAIHAVDYLIQGVAGGAAALNNLLDVSETNDRFGASLAAANFNLDADGADDLAIGIPGENSSQGAVEIVYGAAAGTGLSATGEQFYTQNTANVEGGSANGDEFGFSLAVGFFNGDDNADLAIGVPGDNNAGAVNVLYSAGATGIQPVAVGGVGRVDQIWDQNLLLDTPEAGDRFGQSLAAGDINGDGFTDLAVGVPLENVTVADDGAVNVIFGSATGLVTTGNTFIDQTGTGVDTNEAGDQFGFSLAAGDYDGDGFIDLAVGIPFEDVGGTVADGGAVIVLYTAIATEFWSQNSGGILGTSQAGDLFGSALAAGDFDGNASADLAIGIPGDNVALIDNAGAVAAIYGGPGNGLNSALFRDNQLWNQRNLNQGVAEAGDGFGGKLSSASAGPQSLVAARSVATDSASQGEAPPATASAAVATSSTTATPAAISLPTIPTLPTSSEQLATLLDQLADELARTNRRSSLLNSTVLAALAAARR